MRVDDELVGVVSALHEALRERDERLAIAESCTGGLVGGAMTAVGGASEVFDLGVVAYSNEAKVALLDVPPRTIHHTGAVSGPTARAMAAGIRDRLDATDWGLSITGLAGPGGGHPGKPVGTVYLGLATTEGERRRTSARQVRFDGDRQSIRHQTARRALELAHEAVVHGPSSSD